MKKLIRRVEVAYTAVSVVVFTTALAAWALGTLTITIVWAR